MLLRDRYVNNVQYTLQKQTSYHGGRLPLQGKKNYHVRKQMSADYYKLSVYFALNPFKAYRRIV